MSKKAFLLGTLTGAITGAVAALLFAPKSGRELRGDIADTAHKVGEKTADIGRQAGSAVQSLAQRTSGFVRDLRSRGQASDSSAAVEVAAASEELTDEVTTDAALEEEIVDR
ncbi:YtxH domain-containing protein [Cohnella soli]|uniref:YtxH domain-containing protein n=1 Tax=Cohnella soli TaxID=425005 RepID=A0ABW0HXK1_9BACL